MVANFYIYTTPGPDKRNNKTVISDFVLILSLGRVPFRLEIVKYQSMVALLLLLLDIFKL